MKAWLGLAPEDTEDDAVLQESLDASLTAVDQLVVYPVNETGDDTYSPDMRYAVFLLTQRGAARRNSPEGVVGITGAGGDFVGARLPAGDPDIMRLLGPYLKIPVA